MVTHKTVTVSDITTVVAKSDIKTVNVKKSVVNFNPYFRFIKK